MKNKIQKPLILQIKELIYSEKTKFTKTYHSFLLCPRSPKELLNLTGT